MKNLLVISISYISFFLALTGCKNDAVKSMEHEFSDTIAEFKHYTFEGTEIFIKQKVLNYKKENTGDSLFIFKYCNIDSNKIESTNYVFEIKNEKYLVHEINNKNEKTELIFKQKKTYSINGTKQVVFKFLKNSQIIDGKIGYFFVLDYGLLIRRSTTWKDFKKLTKLKSIDDTKLINTICDIIFNDTDFYKECPNVKIDKKELNKILKLTE